MIEKQYLYKMTEEKTIERIISDGNADINHMILPKGDTLPIHNTNSNVYMIIVSGTISLKLEEQELVKYKKGSIVNLPFNIKMHAFNEDDDLLEFFVVKAPSPQNYK